MRRAFLSFLLATSLGACADEAALEVQADELISETGPVIVDGASTEVWQASRNWSDVSPEAGLAWNANSGLTWEQKYERWIESLKKVEKSTGGGSTFQLQTPEGRTLPAPQLECAEAAIFLRVVFASWHGLPFYLVGKTSKRFYAGHFGFINDQGQRYTGDNYRTAYKDYTSSWKQGQPWPSDKGLRTKHLDGGRAADDHSSFLEEGSGSGSYFDELFLNKRVGHFLVALLDNFGSMHLKNENNMFDIEAEATMPGDVLVKRESEDENYHGHTIPILRRSTREIPFYLDYIEGWMPRRQPLWGNTIASSYNFSASSAGGPGYAEYGGGMKRWRVPTRSGRHWMSIVQTPDVYIPSTDIERLAARTSRFEEILGQASPDVTRDALLERISSMRSALETGPASCSRRKDREEAFAELYDVMAEFYNKTRAEVDAEFRTLEDYTFRELDYFSSKMCCFDDSNADMGRAILAFSEAEQENQCIEPTPFSFEPLADGSTGYDRIRTWAKSNGFAWVDWNPHPSEHCTEAGPFLDVRTERSNEIKNFCE